MSLNITVGITVSTPDGTSLIQVMKADTSLNPNPEDGGAETLLARALLESVLAECTATAYGRLTELTDLIERLT